jgi:hypothetical protein
MLGFDALGRLALGQIPRPVGSVTLTGDKGDLTLTGRDAALRQVTVIAGAKGDLALAGQASVFATITGTINGALTLTGRNASFVTLAFGDGALTLQGQDSTFTVTETTAHGDLTLTGHGASFIAALAVTKADLTLDGGDSWLWESNLKGDLTLTGYDAALTPTAIAISAQLTLTPHWADLKPIGGGSSRKKPRTGFEPVKKHPPEPPAKPEPPKVWTPPPGLVRSPSIVPRLPAPDLVDPDLVPTGLLGIQQQMFSAEDISAVGRFLDQLEQDEQDAADIADVLALLD